MSRPCSLSWKTCDLELEEYDTAISKRYGDGAKCKVEAIELWKLIDEWCEEKEKHRERERQKRKDRVRLPFHFRTLVFPEGADYFSIDFEKGYESLTTFLVFEAILFYPEMYRAFTEVLERGSDYQKVVLNACSLEIRPDNTEIFDELVTGERKLRCEINTEELFFFLLILGDEWDLRREIFWNTYEGTRERSKEWEQRRQEKWERNIIGKKKIKPKGYWEEWKKDLKMDVDGRDLGVYVKEVKTAEITGNNVKTYAACFPKEMISQMIENVIQEAYDNKVRIIENAYMGRAENGMKIALFLSDAGKILRAFPLC